jgi:predicted DNA binding CopG/RHH family protein
MEEGYYQMENYEGDEYQYNETENSVNIRVNSPQISKLDNAELLMKQQDLNDLEDHVIEYHKK